jgi:hypothetical protein
MKQSEIKVGKTYRNRGAGRTTRKVLEIYKVFEIFGDYQFEEVRYEQNGLMGVYERTLRLVMFAQWAGSEVTTDE